MAPSRAGRLLPPPPEATTPACTLPYDLLLEVVARSDVVAVVRSAATCKPLRRDILSPAFIRRVCQHGGPNGGVVPPFLVGYLRVPDKTVPRMASSCFSLVHPETPAATSFSEDQLAPFLSRRAAADLGRRYVPVTSRNGLVVLRRRSSGICVYDPMTGNRAYLPRPLDVDKFSRGSCRFVLLTAADGVGCSFLLLATDPTVSRIQTVSSDDADGAWGPIIGVDKPDLHDSWPWDDPVVQPHSCAVVLNGFIHWLMSRKFASRNFHILTYDVPRHGMRAATTAASIEVPNACLPDKCSNSDLHLTSSPDGRLSLLVADRFTISVWLLSGSSDWARHSVIDTEAMVRSLSPPELLQCEWPSKVDFVRSAGLKNGAVLLRPFMNWDFLNDKGEKGLLLHFGTGEMRRVNQKEGFLYEVDMEARLSAMKIISD